MSPSLLPGSARACATTLPLLSSHLLSPVYSSPHLCRLLPPSTPPSQILLIFSAGGYSTAQRSGEPEVTAVRKWKEAAGGAEEAQRAKEQSRGERGERRERQEQRQRGRRRGEEKCNKSTRQTQTGRECAIHTMTEAECAAWHRNMSREASNGFATGTIQQLHRAHEGRIQRIHVREC